VERGDRVARLDQDEALGRLPLRDPDRPDVAGERVLLEVEEEELEGVRAARDPPDDLAFRENGTRRGSPLEALILSTLIK